MTNKRFIIVIGIILLITALGAGFILYSRKFEMKATNEPSATTSTLNSQATYVETIVEDKKDTLTIDKITAVANGQDKVKITYGSFWIKDISGEDTQAISSKDASLSNPKPYCYGNDPNWPLGYSYIAIKGTSNSATDGSKSLSSYQFSGPSYQYSGLIGKPYNYNDYFLVSNFCNNTGNVSIYLSSTQAETKTLDVVLNIPQDQWILQFSTPLTVTFTAPASSSSSTTTRKTTTTTRSTTPTPSISATLTPTPTIVKHKIPQPTPIVEDASEFFNTRNYVLTGLVVVLLAGFVTIAIIRQRHFKKSLPQPNQSHKDIT